MDSSIAALLGALIGATGPILVHFLTDNAQRRQKARQLSLAIAGELAAVSEIVRRRQYLEGIAELKMAATTGNILHFNARISFDYFPVISGSMNDLGILPGELPVLIPRFLTFAKSVLEDMHSLTHGEWGQRANEEIVEGYDQLHALLEETISLSENIQKEVMRIYPK